VSTPFQQLYDRFFSKTDEDFTGKEGLVFALVDSAISKSYKTVRHSLEYVLTDSNTYDGYFIDDLDNDEIELLSLWMLYEFNRREQQRLVKLKEFIGTKDFNKLPDKLDQLRAVEISMKTIINDINDLKDSFNTYKYN